jgi:prevent-host-death family protein
MNANIATLKNNLSRYLKSVQAGEEVVVLDRERPVARLVPFRAADPARKGARSAVARAAEELETMVQRGALSHGGDPQQTAAWLKSHRAVKAPAGSPALSDVCLQMRGEEPW